MNYNIILVFISLIVVSNCQIPRWGRCPDATVIQNFDASRVSACSFIVVIFHLRWNRFMVFLIHFQQYFSYIVGDSWWKPEYTEKVNDLSQVVDKLYHIMLYRFHLRFLCIHSVVRTTGGSWHGPPHFF